MIGTAIAYGEIRCLIGFMLVLAAYLRKMTLEERFLSEQMGADYDRYRQHVKALIPFVV